MAQKSEKTHLGDLLVYSKLVYSNYYLNFEFKATLP